MTKKSNKAVYFAHKACTLEQSNVEQCMLNQSHVEALLLKGNILLDLKKMPDAMNHYREGLLMAPYRFELHKGLIDCYLAQVIKF